MYILLIILTKTTDQNKLNIVCFLHVYSAYACTLDLYWDCNSNVNTSSQFIHIVEQERHMTVKEQGDYDDLLKWLDQADDLLKIVDRPVNDRQEEYKVSTSKLPKICTHCITCMCRKYIQYMKYIIVLSGLNQTVILIKILLNYNLITIRYSVIEIVYLLQ